MPWSDAQIRALAARAHDPDSTPKERKSARKAEMESTHHQRSRAMSRRSRRKPARR